MLLLPLFAGGGEDENEGADDDNEEETGVAISLLISCLWELSILLL